MDRIGLSFDEYVDVKLKPPAGADRAFHQAAKIEGDEMFPMTTAWAWSSTSRPSRCNGGLRGGSRWGMNARIVSPSTTVLRYVPAAREMTGQHSLTDEIR